MALAQASSTAFLRCKSGRITWTNQALAALLRTDPAALVGQSPDAFVADAGAGLPDWLGGEAPDPAAPLACDLVRDDGSRTPVEVRALGDGEFEIRDLGASRRLSRENVELARRLRDAQQELAEQAERLGATARERDELLTVVSHELQTPLTVVAGFVRLLLTEQAGPLTDDQRKYLKESARSCERLTRFVTHLVDAHPAASEARPVRLSPGCLEETVRSVVDWLRPLANERGQQIEIELDAEARRARFDPVRLEQVMANLLGNALKHGRPRGVLYVRSRVAEEHGLIEVAVCDDGEGVPPEDRERIFEPYVRGEGRNRGAGLGLGLAICRRAIEAHGGSIRVGEAPEGGAQFVFTLPADTADSASTPPAGTGDPEVAAGG